MAVAMQLYEVKCIKTKLTGPHEGCALNRIMHLWDMYVLTRTAELLLIETYSYAVKRIIHLSDIHLTGVYCANKF